jgi:hypothetical protein
MSAADVCFPTSGLSLGNKNSKIAATSRAVKLVTHPLGNLVKSLIHIGAFRFASLDKNPKFPAILFATSSLNIAARTSLFSAT